MGGPLTEAEQFTLRSELGKLRRIGRISRPGKLNGESASAQTFEAINETIISPIDFDDVVEADLTELRGTPSPSSYSRLRRI